MTARAGYSTPMLHVADVARSLRFYALLGFETVDTDAPRGQPPGWARMHCQGGAIMFLQAEEPVRPRESGVLLYMYTPDLPALREHLLAHGVAADPLRHPPYMASGEMRVQDPDGYTVLVGHWGEAEHEAWRRELAEKKADGRL